MEFATAQPDDERAMIGAGGSFTVLLRVAHRWNAPGSVPRRIRLLVQLSDFLPQGGRQAGDHDYREPNARLFAM
ncbi:MAG: DUF4708 domain-containing protein [Azoarcus sp.]|jgi:hypothetical protein|nr:DUF4708 domain-containing protein [Azoarcus sp.]